MLCYPAQNFAERYITLYRKKTAAPSMSATGEQNIFVHFCSPFFMSLQCLTQHYFPGSFLHSQPRMLEKVLSKYCFQFDIQTCFKRGHWLCQKKLCCYHDTSILVSFFQQNTISMSHQDNSNGEQFSRKGVKYFVAALKEFIHDADIYVWKICSIEKLTCQKNADIATNIFL